MTMELYVTDHDGSFTSMHIEVDMMAIVSDVIRHLPSRRYGWNIYYQGTKCKENDLLADLGICPESMIVAKSESSYRNVAIYTTIENSTV